MHLYTMATFYSKKFQYLIIEIKTKNLFILKDCLNYNFQKIFIPLVHLSLFMVTNGAPGPNFKVCVWGLLTPPRIHTSAGCPIIHLNSGTIYPDIATDSTG